MRIPTLLQKISELAGKPESHTVIDVDLMLDYTRVLYADLLEQRAKLVVTAQHRAMPAIDEPTLAELAEAMDEEEEEKEEEEDHHVEKIVYQPQLEFKATPKNIQQPRTTQTQTPDSKPQTPAVKDIQQPPTTQTQTPDSKPQTPDAKDIQQPPTIQTQTPDPKPQTPAANDIRSLISINDKYQILSELFGNDKAAYEDALNHINEAGNEAAAIEWLQERLWVKEENSDAALGFYDLVSRFKRQRIWNKNQD